LPLEEGWNTDIVEDFTTTPSPVFDIVTCGIIPH
jgi:hypothetical protein